MGPAALEQGELDAADLGPQLLLHGLGQHGGQTAQLGVSEAVSSGGLSLGDEGAVGVVDALGHGYHALAGLIVDGLHIGEEPVHVKIGLGQIDQVGTAAGEGGQGGGAGQPAGVAAHNLDDGDHAGVIHVGVLPHLGAGGGDILGRGGKAGAVVGAVQVIVDGLWNTHDAALVAHFLHILGDLVAGVHGVVAAVVEEIADIVLLEDLQDTLVIGIIYVGIRQLVAAGAQGRGGGVFHQVQLSGVLLSHVVQLVLQHTLDAVGGAQHLSDAGSLQGGLDDALGTGVDDGGGAAGLADDTGSSQLIHVGCLLQKSCSGIGKLHISLLKIPK